MLTTEIPSSVTSISAEANNLQKADSSADSLRQSRVIEAMKAQYQADQQAKYLNLQAEAELLLQQLREIKRQREAVEEKVLVQSAR